MDSDAPNGTSTAQPAVATDAPREPGRTGGALGPVPAREGGGWESSEHPPPEPGERKHQIKSEGNGGKERSAEIPETGLKQKGAKQEAQQQNPVAAAARDRRTVAGEEDSVPGAGAQAPNEAETQERWHRLRCRDPAAGAEGAPPMS